jgi:hypothetical protein
MLGNAGKVKPVTGRSTGCRPPSGAQDELITREAQVEGCNCAAAFPARASSEWKFRNRSGIVEAVENQAGAGFNIILILIRLFPQTCVLNSEKLNWWCRIAEAVAGNG